MVLAITNGPWSPLIHDVTDLPIIASKIVEIFVTTLIMITLEKSSLFCTIMVSVTFIIINQYVII